MSNNKYEKQTWGTNGGMPILFMGAAVFKIGLMTLGTFIFNWWYNDVSIIILFIC